jgi:hypothetical protein
MTTTVRVRNEAHHTGSRILIFHRAIGGDGRLEPLADLCVEEESQDLYVWQGCELVVREHLEP